MSYDLRLGGMDEVKVTDQHTAESFKPFTITPGSIYIADAGFGKGKNLDYIQSRQADALLRVTPNHLELAEDMKGKKKINMVEKLEVGKDIVEFTCYVHSKNGQYVPARIIASRLPPDKAEKSIKQKKRAAQKKQSVIKDETLVYAQWVILMTSLDNSYSAEAILKLYRARWQVELLFKRIKQFFKVTRLRVATFEHSKVLALLWLIVWALTEREVIAATFLLIAQQADMSSYSLWSMCEFFFHRLKSMINALCFLCEEVNVMEIYKRLRNHKSGRLNQYAAFAFGS
jgi:hypothetical protein